MNLRLPSRPEGALTLVEYVGVLVVIGLVTGILTPRVLAALDHARLSQTIQSLKAVRAATLDYAGEPARLGGWRGGWDESATNWADVLLAENLLTDPFAPPIARHSWVQVLTVPPDAEPGNGSAFDLGGTGVCSTPPGSQVVVAKLAQVSPADAWALSRRFDGTILSAPDSTRADPLGRVTYPAGGGTVTVYLVHQPAAAPRASGAPGEATADAPITTAAAPPP